MDSDTKHWLIGWVCVTTMFIALITGITMCNLQPSIVRTPLAECARSQLSIQQGTFCSELLRQNGARELARD